MAVRSSEGLGRTLQRLQEREGYAAPLGRQLPIRGKQLQFIAGLGLRGTWFCQKCFGTDVKCRCKLEENVPSYVLAATLLPVAYCSGRDANERGQFLLR